MVYVELGALMTWSECCLLIGRHCSYTVDQEFSYFYEVLRTKRVAFAMCEQGGLKHAMFNGIDNADAT